MSRVRPLLPALLLAAFAFACGTFPGGASWPWAPLGQAAVFLLALAGLAEAGDPLRLGRAGRWLPLALVVAVAGSLVASPVPRAGRAALALIPALLLLPAAVARLLSGERGRRIGTTAWSAVVAAVALVGIFEALSGRGPRAALPLGHHNLLGVFLVVTLPVAALPLRSPGPTRWISALSVLAGVGALVLTRSLGAALAAAAVALVASRRLGPARHLVAGVALLALGLAVPRAAAIVTGGDSSALARFGYGRAAVEGVADSPLLGHGPGSTPWVLARWMRPVPGIHPPGELVGETHSLPLQLGLEIGLPALALAAAMLGLFLSRRIRERPRAADPGLLEAGWLGVFGGAIAGLGGAWLQIPALPVAIVATAGAALAGAGPPPSVTPRAIRAAALILVGCGAAWLVRPGFALWAWERATRASDRPTRARELGEAMRLDPDFPLYRARWSWTVQDPVPPPVRAHEALGAARGAGAVAPLWLRAGALAFEAGEKQVALEAFARTMALDPLSGTAPFLLLVTSAGEDLECGARALLAEPRLAAATWWRSRADLRERVLERVLVWPGIDAGWRQAFVAEARASPPTSGGEEVDLAIEVDRTPALSASLHLFRRSPMLGELTRIRLDRAALRGMTVGSAAEQPLSGAEAFPKRSCAPEALPPRAERGLFGDGFEAGDGGAWTVPPPG